MAVFHKEDYYVKEIPNKLAQSLVIQYHYLHRMAPCIVAYGLFMRQTHKLVGVIMYGTPASKGAREGICGKENKDNVIEITRLWIMDDIPKNAASFLIGNTIRKAPKEIVLAFADSSVGHIGYVYQASNFLYTGKTKPRNDWAIEGRPLHSQTLSDMGSIEELKKEYGDKLKKVPRSVKYRYVYFNCSPRKVKYYLKALRYPILPYPKNFIENA